MTVVRQPGAAVASAGGRYTPEGLESGDSQVVRMMPAARLGATRNASALLVPRGAAGIVARPRLVSQIFTCQRAPEICLLIAPIGCGKSNLLLELAERSRAEGRSVVWLSLTASHSVPEGFLAALDQVLGGKTTLGEPPAVEPIAWAHAAAQQLLMTISQAAATTFCLDNLDELRHPACRALIERLIECWPRGHFLCCAGHSLRGIRVSQALLDSRAAELGPADLALDPLELSALARELNGDDESLSGIESATFLANGWMAGARALLLSKTGSERELQVVPTVLERYFEEKICGALRPEQSQKLMELSTLSTFSATLLAELPEAPIGWDEFELLRNDGIYFERLDTDWSDEFESWYRVQPLLAEYLVLRHRRTNAGRVAALHQFAAEWFEKRGLPDEAVRHALRCKDTEFSTALLERAGALGVGLRQGVALFRATGGLARLSNVRHPLLGLGQVYQDVQEGRVAEARAMFEALRESTCSFQNWGDSNSSPETSRLAALLESILEKYEDRPRSSEALRRLQQHVDAQDGDPIVRATHASLLALAYLGNGLFHEAQTICEIGLGAVRHLRARHVHFCLRVQQTHAAIALGRLQEAALHVERARELAIAAPGGWPQGIAIADVLRGVLHFESNEIEEAEKLLWRALPREPIFTPWFEIYALGFTAKVAIASMKQGATGALEVLADLESLSSRCRIPRLAQLALVLRLRESVRVGNLALAIELSRDERLMALTNGTNDCADIWDLRLRTPALIEVGRLLASLGRTRDAMELLGRINRRHVHEGDARERFGYLALFASVALKLERAEEAFESFGSALDLALQARFTRRILDHRSDLLGVFERAVSDGRPLSARCARFCTSVLRNANDAETCLALERKLLAESRPLRPNEFGLTSRENEVLGFVAEGLSSKEIAYRLSVSESTVKTHRKKVYMKLGVGRRSQAIAKARAKGLA